MDPASRAECRQESPGRDVPFDRLECSSCDDDASSVVISVAAISAGVPHREVVVVWVVEDQMACPGTSRIDWYCRASFDL